MEHKMKVRKRIIMTAGEVARTIRRIASEIVEESRGSKDLAIIGIQTRGVYIAKRIAVEIEKLEKREIPFGVLDITLYRDDVSSIANQPAVKETKIPFSMDNKKIILVDDVLFAGRTVRAALDELIDFGRPCVIRLAVLVDRGLRELPIQPDFVGKRTPTTRSESVHVYLKEMDDYDRVVIEARKPGEKIK